MAARRKEPIPDLTPIALDMAQQLDNARQVLTKALETAYLHDTGVRQRRDEYSEATLVDLGFLAREFAELADQMRKDFNRLSESVAMILGDEMIREATADVDADPVRQGHLALAMAHVKVTPITPNRKSQEYKQALVHMGVAQDLVDNDLVEVRWPSLSEYLRKRLEAGEQMPPFMKTIATPSAIFRRRR